MRTETEKLKKLHTLDLKKIKESHIQELANALGQVEELKRQIAALQKQGCAGASSASEADAKVKLERAVARADRDHRNQPGHRTSIALEKAKADLTNAKGELSNGASSNFADIRVKSRLLAQQMTAPPATETGSRMSLHELGAPMPAVALKDLPRSRLDISSRAEVLDDHINCADQKLSALLKKRADRAAAK